MRVSYICEICDTLIEEFIIDNKVNPDFIDILTEEERHDIMKKENDHRHYIRTVCHNCLKKLWINSEIC